MGLLLKAKGGKMITVWGPEITLIQAENYGEPQVPGWQVCYIDKYGQGVWPKLSKNVFMKGYFVNQVLFKGQ